MDADLIISSGKNPKLKEAVDLYERRHRDARGVFLIEGYREILRAYEAGVVFDALFFCKEYFLGNNEPDLIAKIGKGGVKRYECAAAIFPKLSYRDRPDGLVAVARKMARGLCDLVQHKNKEPFFVIAESIEKPGNLGTILRSADAVQVDGVVVCDRCTDIYNPNVVRASTGALFTVPVIEEEGSLTLEWMKRQGILLVAATPSAVMEFTEAPFKGPLAIVVGTEQLGLSKRWMDASDIQVRIPMLGMADSLNVATATTLLLYEVLRQRKSIGTV